MNKKSAVIIVAANFLGASALAGTMGSVTVQPAWTWVGSFSADPIWESAGHTQAFYLTPDIEKTYVANQSSSALFDGEVFLGAQKALNQHWQVGVGYEFADWGISQLGRAAEQTQNSGLTLNHLYTNGVLFNLTYIA